MLGVHGFKAYVRLVRPCVIGSVDASRCFDLYPVHVPVYAVKASVQKAVPTGACILHVVRSQARFVHC